MKSTRLQPESTGPLVKCEKCPGNVRLKASAVVGATRAVPTKVGMIRIQAAGGYEWMSREAFIEEKKRLEVPRPSTNVVVQSPPVPTAGATRHLLFHVWPKKGTDWRWHAEQLTRRRLLFNGRKVMAVAVDAASESADAVRAALPWFDEVYETANVPDLREVATFPLLFPRVAEYVGPDDVTFYAHPKGITHGAADSTIRPWTATLFETLLDFWPAVQSVLQRFPLAGSYKKLGRGWPAKITTSKWHYSGSFQWFRNRDVFARPTWRSINQFWSGIEFWSSLLFPAEQAGLVFYEDTVQQMNLYDPAVWHGQVEPALRQWRQAHDKQRTPLAMFWPPVPIGLKVELGGGDKPRGGGFVNVDRDGGDVRCDLDRDDLPFDYASVSEVYSSHCLEHVSNINHVLQEICRVCKQGARVEIRVPHPNNMMAGMHGHVGIISDDQVRHWTEDFPQAVFGGRPRRLRLLHTERLPTRHVEEVRGLFPQMTDDQIMRFVPGCCHESCYWFEVIAND